MIRATVDLTDEQQIVLFNKNTEIMFMIFLFFFIVNANYIEVVNGIMLL